MSKLPWIDSALVDLAYKRFENQEERFDSDRKLLLPKLKQKQAGTEKKQVSISSSESPCH